MATSTVAKQYTRILSLWPKDALRPNLPFTRAIERRAIPFGVQPVSPAAEPSKSATSNASQQPAAAAQSSPQAELPNINALYSLLENRYSKKYPLSEGVLKPVSNPEYYGRLMEEIERAPQKSWFQAKMDEWKMKIRWS